MPYNFSDKIRYYLITAQKNVLLYKIDEETGIVANIEEKTIILEPITNVTFNKIGTVSFKIRTFLKSKQRVSSILCIFGDGKKVPSISVFKGKPYEI